MGYQATATRRRIQTMQTRCLGLFLSLPWFVAAPARAEEIFTPQHVARLRAVSSAAISPDGSRVAYLLSVPRDINADESGPPWTQLHLVDAEGNSRPFIGGDVNISAIQWTPDGKSVSFLDKRGKDKTKSVYVIPVDGGEARRVASFDTDITEYSWSPDGKRVVFLAADKQPEEKKKLGDKGYNQEVYEEDARPVRAYVLTVDDENAKPAPLQLPGTPADIVWAPVGSQVAMSLAPSARVDDMMMRKKLNIVDVDSGALVSSFKNPGKLGRSAWSPDGKRLAVISAADINDPAEGRLMIADPSDGSLFEALPDFLGHVETIVWQDKDTVMYLAAVGVWSEFGEVRFDGKDRKIHVPAAKDVFNSFTMSRDGQSGAFISQGPMHPPELLLLRHGDKAPRRLTDSNPWLKDMRFAKQEVVSHKARDGMDLEGLLIRPLDEKPGQRYPLVLVVHGGPEAHVSNGWLTRYANPGQVLAARGFAVFYPNYRGSTGRGVAFSKHGHADAAGKEFDDLVDAVDHLVKSGLVDEKKVGVTGGSYGGFATAWCSTALSERFAAGVMFVGISNLISKTGTTDIPDEEMLVHARKRLWDDNWDFSLKRSPIYHVEKAKTPLLILHGKDDPRVHPAQSLELYRHMKTLGQTPVRLVWYPGEGHGNRKSAAQYDFQLRLIQWFEHYLKGPGGDPPPFDLDYSLGARPDAAAKESPG